MHCVWRTILRVRTGILARAVLLRQTTRTLCSYADREERERGQCRSEGQHIVMFHGRPRKIANVEDCHSKL